MVKATYYHLRHGTHLPILGTFSVVVGALIVAALLVYEFIPSISQPHLAQALTNPSTSSTIATSDNVPAAISIIVPADGAALDELSKVTGIAAPGVKVKVDLIRMAAGSTSGSTNQLSVSSVEISASTTNGAYSTGVSPLKPGNYRLVVQQKNDETWSEPLHHDFVIKPVSLSSTIQILQVGGRGGFYIEVVANRSDLSLVSFSLVPVETTRPPIDLGRGISSGSRVWSFTISDPNAYPSGLYTLIARGEVAGTMAETTIGSIKMSGTTPISLNTNQPTTTTVVQPTTFDLSKNPLADPRETGLTSPETLVVQAVTTIESNANQPTGLKFSGYGPPNSHVTIYIFSSPVIITTLTDGDGNWSYTLDRPLDNGSHQVYVTLTDQTGTVTQKGNPLSFLVAEARAVSPEEFSRFQSQQARQNNSYAIFYITMAGLIVLLAILSFLYFRIRVRHRQLIASR